MWSNDRNCSISLREVYHNLNFISIRKSNFFEGCSWFKFNNLGLAQGATVKFYASVAKGSKLKVGKFWVLTLICLSKLQGNNW